MQKLVASERIEVGDTKKACLEALGTPSFEKVVNQKICLFYIYETGVTYKGELGVCGVELVFDEDTLAHKSFTYIH